jgi:hypothetical protein
MTELQSVILSVTFITAACAMAYTMALIKRKINMELERDRLHKRTAYAFGHQNEGAPTRFIKHEGDF